MGTTTPSGGAQATARTPRTVLPTPPIPATDPQRDSQWPAQFFTALAKTGIVRSAATAAGITTGKAYRRKRASAAFAAQWREALAAALAAAGESDIEFDAVPGRHWRTHFLAGLVETSSVTAAAIAAKVAPSRAYKERAINPRFAAQWRIALHEGYELLELEVLAWLRNPAPAARMDVAGATRLLAAHRETVSQQRALIDNRSQREVLDSIDAMIDEMREREEANAAILAEAEAENATEESDDDDIG